MPIPLQRLLHVHGKFPLGDGNPLSRWTLAQIYLDVIYQTTIWKSMSDHYLPLRCISFSRFPSLICTDMGSCSRLRSSPVGITSLDRARCTPIWTACWPAA